MSARAERAVATQRPKRETVVVNFEAERLKAPFILRCGAFLIDYMLLASAPVISLQLGRMMGYDGIRLLNSEISNLGWLVTLLVGLTNFVIFPMFSCQSVGKMLTGLRIVSRDGQPPKFWALLFRHTVGYLLTGLTLGLGFFLSAVNRRGKALQDYLAGTVVIYGQQRISREIAE